jgi:hypothetical protein
MNLSRLYASLRSNTAAISSSSVTSPIHKIFDRSCEIGRWRLTANRISEIFRVRLSKRLRGKLATAIDQIQHGHHVFRAYWKNGFPLLQRLALPVTIGAVRYLGITIHDTRMIRLEVLLYGGNTVNGWTATQIHEAVLATFSMPSCTNEGRYHSRFEP